MKWFVYVAADFDNFSTVVEADTPAEAAKQFDWAHAHVAVFPADSVALCTHEDGIEGIA